MSDAEMIRRRIKLKTQAIKLIQNERAELGHQLNLLRLRDFLQKRITKDFDPSLSTRLDAVQFLLESFATKPQTSEALSDRD